MEAPPTIALNASFKRVCLRHSPVRPLREIPSTSRGCPGESTYTLTRIQGPVHIWETKRRASDEVESLIVDPDAIFHWPNESHLDRNRNFTPGLEVEVGFMVHAPFNQFQHFLADGLQTLFGLLYMRHSNMRVDAVFVYRNLASFAADMVRMVADPVAVYRLSSKAVVAHSACYIQGWKARGSVFNFGSAKWAPPPTGQLEHWQSTVLYLRSRITHTPGFMMLLSKSPGGPWSERAASSQVQRGRLTRTADSWNRSGIPRLSEKLYALEKHGTGGMLNADEAHVALRAVGWRPWNPYEHQSLAARAHSLRQVKHFFVEMGSGAMNLLFLPADSVVHLLTTDVVVSDGDYGWNARFYYDLARLCHIELRVHQLAVVEPGTSGEEQIKVKNATATVTATNETIALNGYIRVSEFASSAHSAARLTALHIDSKPVPMHVSTSGVPVFDWSAQRGSPRLTYVGFTIPYRAVQLNNWGWGGSWDD